MRERPILFSGAMVRAILGGRKSQTRRAVKPQPAGAWAAPGRSSCPYGQPGERLWVRETHAPRADCWGRWAESVAYERSVFGPGELCYAADGGDPFIEKWRPSIHMPRWACRLVLEVAGVRVERLQAISEGDAEAEGAERDTEPCDHARRSCAEVGCLGPTHRAGFADLWASINGQASWDANPWVWVVDFRRVEG